MRFDHRLIVEISIPFDYTVLNITSFALSSATSKASLMPADGMPMSAKRLSTSGGPEYVHIVYCMLTVWSG